MLALIFSSEIGFLVFPYMFLAISQWPFSSIDSGHRSAHTLTAHRRQIHLPNIVLVTIDTTRADRMGFLGSKHGLSVTVAFGTAAPLESRTVPSKVPVTACRERNLRDKRKPNR